MRNDFKFVAFIFFLNSSFLHANSLVTLKEVEKSQVANTYHLECFAGEKVESKPEQWSPYSVCPKDASVTGLHRIDLLGSHNLPNIHVNDFTCSEKGCRAWCIGTNCIVISQCCRIVSKK
ncbi:MAG: hypothetical protein KBD78_06160 [Oligoflexales bacterium]|nr:hypothetical protein [Oligoflexales bacterium]